ncbi:hypothetical protein O6H91_01G142300 [Diphasiastrum complanatum]|uniref:Uncharacterized protein n=1 Tax=Diphasiastrum complanatum TaxID=34168 RepID=A0ACC2EWX1_DIPCM|nr:hypothetical protein O6H91_01G142300 [Diphasiastrum complanatum]
MNWLAFPVLARFRIAHSLARLFIFIFISVMLKCLLYYVSFLKAILSSHPIALVKRFYCKYIQNMIYLACFTVSNYVVKNMESRVTCKIVAYVGNYQIQP